MADCFPAWFAFENVTYCICRLTWPLIAASLSAEHIWRLLSFMQSLNHNIINDLQSYLIHSDGFPLCQLQRYYQHAVRLTSSRLLSSPQKYFFNSFVEPQPPSWHIQRHFGSYIYLGHRSRRCSKCRFCSALLHEGSPNRCAEGRFQEVWRASVQQWESSSTLMQKFVIIIIIHHHQKKPQKTVMQNYHTFCCWLNLPTSLFC